MPKESLAEITSAPELVSTSEAEQMYLITVARAAEAGKVGPVPISQIADALAVSVPSANEMVRKLDARGFLTYEPYRGVRLSKSGTLIANQVLRTRRLWATFLAQHLGFTPSDADDQACHLEHATTPEAANRLAAFLGNPEAGPLGRRIPAGAASERTEPSTRLADLPVGAVAEIVAVAAIWRSYDFLAAEGLTVGARVTIAAAGESGILLELEGTAIHLGRALASSIDVRSIGGTP